MNKPDGYLPTAPEDFMWRLGVNEKGTPVSVHRCESCGCQFTVCPLRTVEQWGTGCLADTCESYDIERDVDIFFEPLADAGLIRREVL